MKTPEARVVWWTLLADLALIAVGVILVVWLSPWGFARSIGAVAGLAGSATVVTGGLMLYRIDPEDERFRTGYWDDTGRGVPTMLHDQQRAAAVVVVGAAIQFVALIFAVIGP